MSDLYRTLEGKLFRRDGSLIRDTACPECVCPPENCPCTSWPPATWPCNGLLETYSADIYLGSCYDIDVCPERAFVNTYVATGITLTASATQCKWTGTATFNFCGDVYPDYPFECEVGLGDPYSCANEGSPRTVELTLTAGEWVLSVSGLSGQKLYKTAGQTPDANGGVYGPSPGKVPLAFDCEYGPEFTVEGIVS